MIELHALPFYRRGSEPDIRPRSYGRVHRPGPNTYFKEHCKAIAVYLRNGVFAGSNDVLEKWTGQPTTLPECVGRCRQAFA